MNEVTFGRPIVRLFSPLNKRWRCRNLCTYSLVNVAIARDNVISGIIRVCRILLRKTIVYYPGKRSSQHSTSGDITGNSYFNCDVTIFWHWNVCSREWLFCKTETRLEVWDFLSLWVRPQTQDLLFSHIRIPSVEIGILVRVGLGSDPHCGKGIWDSRLTGRKSYSMIPPRIWKRAVENWRC